ncbi:RtcB family protein [Candidatus Pacearchaeota archaeon]|nr:RtcB family protein [Candidatus Pacearchaeota archaeon]
MVEVNKISKYIYEIPKHGKMQVPARIYASESILEAMKKDQTLEQIKNVACLPGILKNAINVPDGHQGYGFPIGGIAAFDAETGIITPAGVGYDINCSVRLLRTNLTKKQLSEKQDEVLDIISKKIPSGLGRGSKFNISKKEFNTLLEKGAKYLVDKGYGFKEDYEHTEESGCLKNANPEKVSGRAIKRGVGQLGTLGAGNHFLEIGFVEEVFDKKIAKAFDLKRNQVTIMIHCGSRGLGHQIASDYIEKMKKEFPDIMKNIPDKDLIYAPIKSQIGKDCIEAMACATNYAFANKQLITHWLRESLSEIFPKIKINVVYDVCHNIAKFEKHKINGKIKKVLIHRKGATRSFGPGRKEIPKKYRSVGQPVIIPGSMGTASYVLVGTKLSEELTFGSTVHGAGRAMSIAQAIKKISKKQVQDLLSKEKIKISCKDEKCILSESPDSYKDVNEVVKIVDELGISKKIAKLKPVVVLK